MTTFTISGSVDSSTGPAQLGSYKATVYGTIAIGDTSRTPLAVIRNCSTGSVNIRLSNITVSISPKGNSQANDVCLILGARAFGSVSGSAFTPQALDSGYPTSVASTYGSIISGPTLRDPTAGFMVPAQAQLLSTSPSPPIVITNVNAQILTKDPIILAPGESYVVSLTQEVSVAGTPNFVYIVEFGWAEVA